MIHVVTPFSRPENTERMVELLVDQRVLWHPLMDGGVEFPVKADWIQPLDCGPAFHDIRDCYGKLNTYIEQGGIVATDRYCVLNDDDAYPRGFMDRLRELDQPVVICSMKRGQFTPPSFFNHPTFTLVANPDHMIRGMVGLEQVLMLGSVFGDVRYPLLPDGDGHLAEHLFHTREDIHYEPDLYVLFNYLEPGRWTEEAL